MNYRHAYHAGNFADVVKHVILTRVIAYMLAKDKPLFLLDTHAGIGAYDLSSEEAGKTGEAEDGIARLITALPSLSDEARALLAPYLAIVQAEPARYPGSPSIMAAMMRRQDRAAFIEKHPADAQTLADVFAANRQVRVHDTDGWTALKAMLPPPEKRGITLIDPPFEEKGEFNRLVQGLSAALKRFATGTFLLWYPIKDSSEVARLREAIGATMAGVRMADTRFLVDRDVDANGFRGSGMVIVNAPFTLETELATLMPELVRALERSPNAGAWQWQTLP